MAVEQTLDVEEFQLSPLVETLSQNPQDATALAALTALLTRLEGHDSHSVTTLSSFLVTKSSPNVFTILAFASIHTPSHSMLSSSPSLLAGTSAITTACRGSTGLTLGAYVLAPALDRALALVSHAKNAKDNGLALLTTLVKDVKGCSVYTKATTLTTNSATASAGAIASGGNAPANNKGKKSQPSSSNGTSKDSAAAAPVDITLPTTPYTPPTPQIISALPSVDLTALGLMSALKLLFTEALHSAFPQVPTFSQIY